MKLTDFRVLTFDCYGTLIDWEKGITRALQPLIEATGVTLSRDEILAAFAAAESDQEKNTPGLTYPEILTRVHARLARELGGTVPDEMHSRFGASVPDWPAFPDSAGALAYLSGFYKLVILSNVDRISFRESNRQLGVEFDAVYTAQDIGSYKPDPRNFDYLLANLEKELGFGPSDILHTAQSLFHDHEPAKRLGLATAWIDRRGKNAGGGATMAPAEQPAFDFRFDSMAGFVQAHQEALGSGWTGG